MNFYSSILQFTAKSKNDNFQMQEHSSAPASGFYRKATSQEYYPCLHCLNSVYYSNCLNSSMYADIYCQGRLKHNWTGQLSCWAKTWGDWSGWWVLPLLTTRAPTVLQNIKVGKVKVLGKLPKIFTCAAMCQSSVMPILRLSKKLSQFSSRTSAFPIAPFPGFSWSFLAARAALYLHRKFIHSKTNG